MSIVDTVLLSLKHIFTQKLRTLLNVAGFVVGTASVIAVLCVADGGKAAIENKLDKMGMDSVAVKTNGTGIIDYGDYVYLKNTLQKNDITPVYMNYAEAFYNGKKRDVVIWGVAEGFENIYDIELAQGRFFNKYDLDKSKNVAIAESVLAQSVFLGIKANDTISLSADGKTVQTRIIGITDDRGESLKNTFADAVPVFIYMPVTAVMEIFDTDELDYISLKSDNTDTLAVKSVRLLQRRGGGGGYYVENMAAQKAGFDAIIRLVSVILGAIAAISLVVSVLGVINIMLMTVSERTGEIGIMKAVGAKNSDIMLQFLSETVIIISVGALAGCFGGYFAGKASAQLLGIPFVFNVKTALGVTGALICAAAVFGVYPAKIAAKIDPAKILK